MKTNFKRLFALVLTLCMLASLMVPVAFADDETTEAPSANVAETYPIRLKDMNNTDANAAVAGSNDYLMTKQYKLKNEDGTDMKDEDGNQLYGRKYTGDIAEIDTASSYNAETLNWTFFDYTASSLAYRSDRMWQLRSQGGWVAMKIRVSNPGAYSLAMISDRTLDQETELNNWTSGTYSDTDGVYKYDFTEWTGDITAYIIPLSVVNAAAADMVDGDLTAQQQAIESLMTSRYCVGTNTLAVGEDTVTFSEVSMDSDEYIVVYDATSLYCLAEMQLIGEAYELENVATYDMYPYDLSLSLDQWADHEYNKALISVGDDGVTYATYNGTPFTGYYDTLGWKHVTSFGSSAMIWGRAAFMNAVRYAGEFAAYQIKVPQSGYMYLSLTTENIELPAEVTQLNLDDKPTEYARNMWKGTANVTAYLIPAADLAGTTVADLIADDTYCVGTKLLRTEENTVTFNKAGLSAGDYVVAFIADEGYYGVTEMKLDMFADQKLPEAEQVTGATYSYDFQLYNNERYANIFNGAKKNFTNKAELDYEDVYKAGETVKAIVEREYEAGVLNWKYLEHSAAALTFRPGSSLRFDVNATTPEGYAAFALNVPEAGVYNVNLNLGIPNYVTANVYVLDASLKGDIVNNLTVENLKYTSISGAKANSHNSFVSYFSAGENILVIQQKDAAKERNLAIRDIQLTPVQAEAKTYTFGTTNTAEYDAKVSYLTNGAVTDITPTNLRYTTLDAEYTDVYGTTITNKRVNHFHVLGCLFTEGTIDWYADTIRVGGTASSSTYSNYKVSADSSNLKIELGGDGAGFAAIRIRVPNAGVYNVDIDMTSNKSYSTYIVYDMPLNHVDGSSKLPSGVLTADEADAAMVDANLLGSTHIFDAAGEYLIIFKTDVAESTTLTLTSISLTPVSANYIADRVPYTTFGEALKNAESGITMLDNAIVGNAVLNSDVTLDLNGYDLYVDSLEAAPGAQIVDGSEGEGLIKGAVDFYEYNDQLPLFDAAADGYRLYSASVESVTVTGKNSSTPKYWFKVAMNSNALPMISDSTELRIQAALTFDETTAYAKADAAFSASWAEKYAANDGIYITVSAINADAAYTLAPQITANGVIMAGNAMESPVVEESVPETSEPATEETESVETESTETVA